MNKDTNAKRGLRLYAAPSLLGALICFTCLWLLDFPKPSTDDLFQAGAGMHLAEGGDFSNPLLARQEFPSHYFFEYPPLNSYVLAGWLKICGISAAAMTGYTIFSCLVTCAATIIFLRRQGASVWLEWLVPLGVMFGILYLGPRPEPLAIALVMSGLAITDAESQNKKLLLQFLGFLLIFLGGSAAPRVTIFVAAVACYAGWLGINRATTWRGRLETAACWCSALAASGLALVVMIGFRITEFLHTFNYVAAGRLYKNKYGALMDYLFSGLGYLQLPLIILPLILMVWIIRKPKDGLSRPALWIATAFPLVVLTGGIGSGAVWWAFLVMILLAGSLLKSAGRAPARALQVLLLVILLVADRKIFAQCWGIATGQIKSDRGPELAAVLALRPTPEHPVLVDGWVGRYVYDYRLPAGVLDEEWCVRFPGGPPGAYPLDEKLYPQLHSGDLFVIGSYMLNGLRIYTLLERDKPPVWRAFDLSRLEFDQYPCRAYIIPSDDCKGMRPGAASTLPVGQ